MAWGGGGEEGAGVQEAPVGVCGCALVHTDMGARGQWVRAAKQPLMAQVRSGAGPGQAASSALPSPCLLVWDPNGLQAPGSPGSALRPVSLSPSSRGRDPGAR